MSWTVHEDEYRSAEPNVEDILQHVVDGGDNSTRKVAGRYTKSSQVFASPTPLTPAELATPIKEPTEAINAWVPPQSPSHSPMPGNNGHGGGYVNPHGGGGHHSHHMNGNGGKFGRYQVASNNSSSSYERHHKATVGRDQYSGMSPPAMGRRGMPGARYDRMPAPPDGRPMHNSSGFSEDMSYQQDMMAGSQMDWGAAMGNKYQPLGPMANPFGNVTAENLQGKVYETAKDQHGCRFLQKWLDTNCDQEAVQVIMNEIIPHVAELMTDQYANFLVQKLFDIMPDDVRYNVAVVAAPKISMIALTPHGTFSVQKMIETISTREEMEIVREALCKDVVRLVKDAHGNHVIQKVLQRFDYPDKEFIYRAVADDCVAIAKNKQGCCVLQRCLEYASMQQKVALIDRVLRSCLEIVQDPFGNYVLQYVLDANESKINDTIAIAFLPHLVHLCMNKFSSNVMEKVLRGASAPVQEMYVDTMCNHDIVTRLIQDDFGNYVLQTALSISTPVQAEILIATMRPLLHLIKNAPYAKKLEGKMDGIIRKTANGGGGNSGSAYRGSPNHYEVMGHADNGPQKYHGDNSNNGYQMHHFQPDPHAASWQTPA